MTTTIFQAILILIVLIVGIVLLSAGNIAAGGLTVGVCIISFYTEILPALRGKKGDE